MAKNSDNLIYFTLRLNLDNPQHMKVGKVLKNLNPERYKSANKYMIDAIDFFIDHGNDDTYAEFVEPDKCRFVRKEDFDYLQEKVCEKAIMSAKDEIIRLLGDIVVRNEGFAPVSKQNNDVVSVDISEDSTINELVSDWE